MSQFKSIILFIFCPFLLNGQNIIPNGDFEDTIYFKSFNQVEVKEWISPSKGTPDYFSEYNMGITSSAPLNAVGYQLSKSNGKGYMGFYTVEYQNVNLLERREYIQNKLKFRLEKDTAYCLQFFISLSDSSNFATKGDVGVYFSTNQINVNTSDTLSFEPQLTISDTVFYIDKENWVKINLSYVAKGGESHIIIGNFNSSIETDSLHVLGGNEVWHQGAYYYIDDVYLGHCDSIPLDTPTGIAENSFLSKIKGYPNPVTDLFVLENNSNQPLSFQLYNLMGQSVVLTDGASRLRSTTHHPSSTTHFRSTPHRYEFSMGHLPKGIYLLQVVGRNERATIKIVKE